MSCHCPSLARLNLSDLCSGHINVFMDGLRREPLLFALTRNDGFLVLHSDLATPFCGHTPDWHSGSLPLNILQPPFRFFPVSAAAVLLRTSIHPLLHLLQAALPLLNPFTCRNQCISGKCTQFPCPLHCSTRFPCWMNQLFFYLVCLHQVSFFPSLFKCVFVSSMKRVLSNSSFPKLSPSLSMVWGRVFIYLFHLLLFHFFLFFLGWFQMHFPSFCWNSAC